MKQKHLFKNLLALLLMVAAGQGSAWATSAFSVTASTVSSGTKFKITRTGNTAVSETVDWRVVSLSAIEGVHYNGVQGGVAGVYTGTVTFGVNEEYKEIIINELAPTDAYQFQNTTTRSYRFEVLDKDGYVLAYKDRSITTGIRFTNELLNKSVTDLVYFNDSKQIMSGDGNKYFDVSYPSSNWIQVTDAGYSQAVHTVSTDSLFIISGTTSSNISTLRTYLNNLNYMMYATVYFTQKEEHDGYQYIQILTDNSSTYDGNDGNGSVNTPSTSKYKACFIMTYSPSGSAMSYPHKQFFPHRYDYHDKSEENAANISHHEFDSLNIRLYQQAFKGGANSSYRASTSGSLVLPTTTKNINIRFDAAGGGNDHDEWDFKNLKVRLALVDTYAPTVVNNYKVSGGRHQTGNTFYVSVAFSEIVVVTGTPTLASNWGTLSYIAGSGSNVLTFKGTINPSNNNTFSVSSYSGTIKDLAGNSLSGSISCNFGTTLDADYVWSTSDFRELSTNTYEIYTKLDLRHLALLVNKAQNNCSGKTFKQTADITCDTTYIPIGYKVSSSDYARFQGTYDGQGHTVSGITVSRTGSNSYSDGYIGLFGYTSEATVQNVVLANSTFTGSYYVGGIVGNAYSSNIINCRVENNVTIKAGANDACYHGGIAGYHGGSSGRYVRGCISAVSIKDNGKTGHKDCGGIVGQVSNSGTVKNCLYIGTTVEAASYKGAIVGRFALGTLTNNYYTTENLGGVGNGQSNSSGNDCDGARRARSVTLDANVALNGDETEYDVSGLTAVGTTALSYNDGTTTIYSGEGQTLTFSHSGVPATGYVWNGFSATGGGTFTGNTLTMPADNTTVSATTRDVWGVTNSPAADGSEAHPYLISDTTGLNLLARNVNGTDGYTANEFSGKFFHLANNITYSYEGLDATASNYTAISGYFNGSNRYFRGTFDGNNDTISGIRIYKGGTTDADGFQGLFGWVSGGTIKNLTLTDAVITGRQNVGGIAGYISMNNSTGGIIDNCHVTGSVTLHAVVDNAIKHGGIVGNVNGGSVSGCTSAATLSYASGHTSCTIYGGLVGFLNGSLQNCLVLGANVSGTNHVGAVAGIKGDNNPCTANYYRGCTVGGTANATNVGIGSEGGSTPPKDIDGVRSLHTLTLGDGITATGASETKVIDNVTYYASASTITLSYTGTPATGYAFDSISVDAGTLSGSTLTFTPAADVTATAVFTPITYNITYNLAGGSASNPATYNIGTPTFTLTNPTREGYTFVGWTGTGLDAATTSVSVAQGSTGDRSYIATWTPTVYNITYNLGGGNLATPNPATYTIETSTFTLANPAAPTGYTFAGWTGTGLDAATTTVTVAQGSTGDRSYTATWTPIVYNITYDLAGGSASNPATYTIETSTFTLANPAAPIGYTFAGWTGTGLAEATATVTIAQGSIGDRSYTATWTDVWNIAGGANGTNEAPYIITSTAGLDLLATLVNGGNKFNNTFFKLGADIDYPYTTAWNDATSTESNYTAIGTQINFFKGTFDGQGHTVSGIRIYKTNTDYQGLFGYLGNDARVKNVTVADARITGDQYVGGIAGINDANIDNCVSSSVAVTATNFGDAYCGGITGRGVYGDISNCLVLDAIVSGSSNYIGAVAGDAGTNDILYSLYYNCTVGGVENATGVGCNGSDWNSDFHLVPARRLTLAPNVTASNTFAYGEHYYIARNRIVTLDYSGAVDYDQAVVYSAGGNELPFNSFTVTADTVVTAALVSATQHVPYSYDFEDETPFRYWRPLTGSYYLTYSEYNNTDCLRIIGTTSNLMLLPPFDAEVNTLMLNLKFRSGGNSNNYGTFSVGYVTDAADPSTFTAVATYSYAESQGNWIQKAEYFTGIPAGARLALRSNPVYSSYSWYVDDIEVAVAPSCIPPQDLTLATMDAVSASFAWRSVDGAQWEYCLLDTDREPVDADFAASTTASSVTIDNLTPATVYRFHLRRRCDAQSTSTVGTLVFITPASVPFTDDFEATQCRWTVKANSTNCWCQGSAVNNGGSQALYVSDDNGTHRHSSYGSGYFYAYMRFSLEAGVYAFSYDLTNNDEGFLRVALVPDNIDLDNSNISYYLQNSSNPPSGWLWLDGNVRLRFHPDWVPRTEIVDVSAAGLYKMVFFWYNYGECDYPAAVDNVRVTIPRTFTTAGRWDVASNWSPAGVPAADEIVVVRAAATIPSGCVAMANNISVGNDGSLTLADGGQLYTHSSNLPITVQKEVRANQWSAFALIGYYSYSPNDVDNLTSAAYDLFGYDEPSATWVNKKNNWLNIIQGYIYRRAADATLSYDNNVYGSTNFRITVYRQYGDDALKGFNLVGNMTPHNVVKGSGLYLKSNASWATGYYTLEADGSWRAHPDSDSIAPGQAVLVQLTAANETSVISCNTELDWPSVNSKGGSQNTQNNQSPLTFTVSDGEHSDVAYVLTEKTEWNRNSDGSDNSVRGGLRKFGHQDADLPSLSIAQGDGRYAIAAIGEETKSFDLAFSGKAGTYTFKQSSNQAITYLHLIDRLTGKDVDLLRDSSYTFTMAAGSTGGTPRFLVKLSPNAAQDAHSAHFAYQYGDQLIVEGEGTLTAYDVMGRLLLRREIKNEELRIENSEFPGTGVFILKLNGQSQKVVIR